MSQGESGQLNSPAPHRRAGRLPRGSEDIQEEVGEAVDHRRLLGVLQRAVDEPVYLDDASDVIRGVSSDAHSHPERQTRGVYPIRTSSDPYPNRIQTLSEPYPNRPTEAGRRHTCAAA